MSETMKFADREEFREWLREHCLSNDDIWLLFGKAGGPKTIKAGEALEEALCFGWIDGQMEKIDDKTYQTLWQSLQKNRLPVCLHSWKGTNLPAQIFKPCLHL